MGPYKHLMYILGEMSFHFANQTAETHGIVGPTFLADERMTPVLQTMAAHQCMFLYTRDFIRL